MERARIHKPIRSFIQMVRARILKLSFSHITQLRHDLSSLLYLQALSAGLKICRVLKYGVVALNGLFLCVCGVVEDIGQTR